MQDNWVVENLQHTLSTWNEKLAEIWTLLTVSPKAFRGGAIWQVILDIHGALQAICKGWYKNGEWDPRCADQQSTAAGLGGGTGRRSRKTGESVWCAVLQHQTKDPHYNEQCEQAVQVGAEGSGDRRAWRSFPPAYVRYTVHRVRRARCRTKELARSQRHPHDPRYLR